MIDPPGRLIKKHGSWWLPATEDLGLKWFDNERGERPEVIDAAIRKVTSFDIALDVGAHVGTWTVELPRHFTHVHAFEPIISNWIALAYNLEQRNVSSDKVTPWLVAVADKMANCRPTGIMNATMSSHIDPGKGGRVPVIALDEICWGKVSLIKIDVEGCEWHVLKGAERLLEFHHPTLVIEWKEHRLNKHGDYMPQIEALLEHHGYRLAEQLEIDRIYV